MIKAMNKEYPQGKKRCYKVAGGGKICASSKAWSVFFAKITKEYGKGSETKKKIGKKNSKKTTKKKRKKAQESEKKDGKKVEETEVSQLEKDMIIEWYLKEVKKEKKDDV